MSIVSKILGVLGGIAIVAIGAALIWYFMIQTPYRRSLPPEAATDIMEETLTDSAAVSTYFLRARLKADAFPEYCSKLKFSLLSDMNAITGEARQYASWKAEKAPSWWNPSESMLSTYYSVERRSIVLAKHENGFLYIKAVYF